MRTIVAIILLLFSFLISCNSSADAATNRLILGGWSKHLIEPNSIDYWNETHNVIGFETKSRYSLIYFDNSYGEKSYGIGKTQRLIESDKYHLGIYWGLWNNYDKVTGSGYIPAFAIRNTFEVTKRANIDLYLNPVVVIIGVSINIGN